MATQDRCVTIQPYFKVSGNNLAAFREVCEQCVDRASTEPKCLYYGFSFNGNEVHCREGYEDAAGALAHLDNIQPLLTKALELGELTRLEIHGVEEELAKLRAPLAPFNPAWFTLEFGIRR